MTPTTLNLRSALLQCKPIHMALLPAVFALVLLGFPLDSFAQFGGSGSMDVPFITEIGCKVVKWMKGPLAILIFVVICIATLVIGMISKMDWSRIITVCVIFGIVISLGSMLAGSSFMMSSPTLSSCLMNPF
jgi:type IV secretory pathway VirB2 component (pilin)